MPSNTGADGLPAEAEENFDEEDIPESIRAKEAVDRTLRRSEGIAVSRQKSRMHAHAIRPILACHRFK